METLKHLACTVGWVARLCYSLLFLGKGNPNFPWEKSHLDNKIVKKKKVIKEEVKAPVIIALRNSRTTKVH